MTRVKPHPRLVTEPPELARELLTFIFNNCSAEQLIREHTVDARGICPSCHWHGPCTIHTAASVVKDRGGSLLDQHMKALKILLADYEEYGDRPKRPVQNSV